MSGIKYVLITLLLACTNLLFAQDHPPSWGGGADEHDLSFGFTFSSVNNYFKIYKNPDWQTPFLDKQNGNQAVTSPLTSISSKNTPGFGVCFITRFRLTDPPEAPVNPSLVFADRGITYTFT